jgi:hypothetical protein
LALAALVLPLELKAVSALIQYFLQLHPMAAVVVEAPHLTLE